MSTAARPLRKDAERNRQRILEAAREVFAERGLTATLDDVAAHAGVGVGTVYRRFEDKDALIEAVLDTQVDLLVGFAEEGLRIEDPWEGLRHFMQQGLALQASHRGIKELMFASSRGQIVHGRLRERIYAPASALLERAQAAGVVRDDLSPTDIPLMQFMVIAVIDFAGPVDQDLWRRYSTILLDGLRPAREAPTPLPVESLPYDDLGRAMSGWRPRSR